MKFRDYAATQAADAVGRVVVRTSDSSRQELEAVRTAIDAALTALASATPSAEDDRDTADLIDGLVKASDAVAEEAARRATDEGQKTADALRAELQEAGRQKMAVSASLKEAEAQANTLRGELKLATERGEAANRQLADARRTAEKLQAARDELTAERDEEAGARASAENSLRATQDALEAARADLAATARKLDEAAVERASVEEALGVAQSQGQAAEAKVGAVTDLFKQSAARVKALERVQQDQERTIRELEAQLKTSTAAGASASASGPVRLSLLDDLLAGFEALGASTSISDVLTTFVEQLAAQFPRVALFRVKKSHLQGEHQIGFDLNTDIAKVIMPLGMDSLLARAASSGQIERLSGDELKDSSRAPFSGTPRSALAVPIVVSGETLAIVYADDSGAPAQKGARELNEACARFAGAMQQHAVALLMRMTSELKMRAELQAYAHSLVSELEQMYTSDVQSGTAADQVRERLKGNLQYARSTFDSRVALEGGEVTTLFADELAAVLDADEGTPFSRDLAIVAGRPELATRSRNAAEAS